MNRRNFLAAAAAPLVLGAAPAFARSLGGTPLALVTADLESSVVAVNVDSGKVLRRLQTPADPRSIESIGQVGALVAHTAGGRMTLIDSDLRVRSIAGEFGAPRYTAVSPDWQLAYVTDSARQEIVVIDVRGRRVTGRVRVDVPSPRHRPVGHAALGCAGKQGGDPRSAVARRTTTASSDRSDPAAVSRARRRLHARRRSRLGDVG